MNKLLLFTLIGFALVALTMGDEEVQETEMVAQETAVEEVDAEELADPSAKRKNKRKNKKAKKGKKKGKKNKKAKKGKRKNNKNKKNKKSKNAKRKNKKNKKGKKKSAKGKKRQLERATCSDACVTNSFEYMSKLNSMVGNLVKQINRAKKHAEINGKKLAKKNDFAGALADAVAAGGDDKSNLKCAGKNATSEGGKALKKLVTELEACPKSINASCGVAGLPKAPTTAEFDNCTTYAAKFKNMTAACGGKTSMTESCSCWAKSDIKSMLALVTKCASNALSNGMKFKAYQTAVTNAKKKCITSFGACRKLEASTAQVISACKTNDAALKIKAKKLTENKASAAKVSTHIAAALKHSSGRRKRSTAACSSFVVNVGFYSANLTNNQLANVSALSVSILAYSTSSTCSTTDIASLKTHKTTMDKVVAAITSSLAAVQAKLTVLTGSTASSSVIAAVSTNSTSTNSTNSTSGRRLRSAFRNLVR